MNTIVTSKEAILDISIQLVQEKGWEAVNIRSVAAACGVSIGSIYNYFSSKSDLMGAIVERVWHDIFHFPNQKTDFIDFSDCVQWIFDSMKKGGEKYPGFFTLHSMSFLEEDKAAGRQLMEQSWKHIQSALYSILTNDKKVRPGAFNTALTPQQFTDIIFSLIISSFLLQNYDSGPILEIIKRTIYK